MDQHEHLDPAAPRRSQRSAARAGRRRIRSGAHRLLRRDRSPAVIARVADAGDVSHVIALARETGLEPAVRSGGHSPAGHGVSGGGICSTSRTCARWISMPSDAPRGQRQD